MVFGVDSAWVEEWEGREERVLTTRRRGLEQGKSDYYPIVMESNMSSEPLLLPTRLDPSPVLQAIMIPTIPRLANLPRLLSLLPKDGLNSTIYQTRWAGKGFPTPSASASAAINDGTCRWEVKKVRLAFQETDNDKAKVAARAWGVFYWKGGSRSLVLGAGAGRAEGANWVRLRRQEGYSGRQGVRADQGRAQVRVGGAQHAPAPRASSQGRRNRGLRRWAGRWRLEDRWSGRGADVQ